MSLIPTEKSVKIENPKEFFADEVFIVNRKNRCILPSTVHNENLCFEFCYTLVIKLFFSTLFNIFSV